MEDALLQPKTRPPRLTEIEAELLRRDFRKFIRAAWSQVETKTFTPGWHIDAVADHLVYVTTGEISNLLINLPPRHSKSSVAGVLWPVWSWIQTPPSEQEIAGGQLYYGPGLQFLCASYASQLAMRDAVKSRQLMLTNWFQERYGHLFSLRYDQNQKSRYSNDQGGYRIATGVGGTATGDGGDIQLLDDPNNLKEIYSDTVRQGTNEWLDNVWRNRTNDPNNPRRVCIQQRGHDADVSGHILEQEDEGLVHLVLPAEYDPKRICVTPWFKDPRKKTGEVLCPDRMDKHQLDKQYHAMSERDYHAQYQQDPMAGSGLILKADQWRKWPHKQPPPCFEIVSSYDTAFEEDEEADFNARTTWGLFEDDDGVINCLLVEAWEERCGYPELRKEAKRHQKEFEPDWNLIEKKASGHALVKDLRKARIPVKAIPIKGGRASGKVVRAHIAAQALREGRVWYMDKSWSKPVIKNCAKFPAVDHDDTVDTVTQALQYMLTIGVLESDDQDMDRGELDLWNWKKQRKAVYA